MGQTVISWKNHWGMAPLAPLAPTPLIIVHFSALAIPAESAIADKKRKKERKITLFSTTETIPEGCEFHYFQKLNWRWKKNRENKVCTYLLMYCSVAKTKKKESTCKSQWKMDLGIDYTSDIIIDNFSYVCETNYTSSNCTMRWNIFRRSISGLIK